MARNNYTDRPPAVMVWFDMRPCVETLTREQRGDLFLALFDYGEKDIEITTGEQITQAVFTMFKKRIDSDREHYKEKRAKRAENAFNQWKEHNFNVFWSMYPRKENEAQAREIFYALNAKQSEIINELKYEKEQNGEWLSGYIPLANEWLSDRGNVNGWFD